MTDPRWHVHGTNPGHLVLYRSVEEGPLAEIACHGDVDPAQVAGALNDAAMVEQVRRERDTAHAVIRRLLHGAKPKMTLGDQFHRWETTTIGGDEYEPMSPVEVDAIRAARAVPDVPATPTPQGQT